MLFLVVFAAQFIRALVGNGWHIVKSFIQLHEIKKAEDLIFASSKRLEAEVRQIKEGGRNLKLLRASSDLNLVGNPDRETIVEFQD